jgi:hypothetical protein
MFASIGCLISMSSYVGMNVLCQKLLAWSNLFLSNKVRV